MLNGENQMAVNPLYFFKIKPYIYDIGKQIVFWQIFYKYWVIITISPLILQPNIHCLKKKKYNFQRIILVLTFKFLSLTANVIT